MLLVDIFIRIVDSSLYRECVGIGGPTLSTIDLVAFRFISFENGTV